MIKEYLYIMKYTFFKNSLNRIFQQIYAEKKIANGTIVEFGAEAGSVKNFTNFIKLEKFNKIIYCDKFPKKSETLIEDLEKKLSLADNSLDSIIVFNVLEHVFETKNAFLEINRCLKINSGIIIGSTPFIHRIHGAPNDYNRYTKQYLEKILDKTNFRNIKVENFGYGPFTAAYVIIFDYLKLIPFLNNILLTICMFLDKFINLFIKTEIKNLYPITICFSAEKK